MTRWMVLLSVGWAVACTKPNPNRCCTDEADCVAKDIPVGNQCEQGLVCRGNQCIAQPCTSNDSCDAAAPYCVAELCAEQCAEDVHCPGFGQSPDLGYCVTGMCSECRDAADCSAAAPVCDAGRCRTCNAHSDCASALCDIDAGTCVDSSSVLYASPGGGSAAACSLADPCSLTRALELVDATRSNVKLAEGTYPDAPMFQRLVSLNLFGPARISGGFTYSSSGRIQIRDIAFDAVVAVSRPNTNVSAPTMDLRRVEIVGDNPTSPSLSAANAALTATDVTIRHPFSSSYAVGGSGSMGSDLVLDRVDITGGIYGIQLFSYATLRLTNSLLRAHADSAIRFIGTDTNPTSSSGQSVVSFTTFHNTVLACPGGQVLLSASNNIFVNDASDAPANTVSGAACRHTYSLITPQSAAPVGANNLTNMDPRFVNAGGGDFHLMAGSPAVDAADPAATEAVDFDGTVRPQGAGRDIGAFELAP